MGMVVSMAVTNVQHVKEQVALSNGTMDAFAKDAVQSMTISEQFNGNFLLMRSVFYSSAGDITDLMYV